MRAFPLIPFLLLALLPGVARAFDAGPFLATFLLLDENGKEGPAKVPVVNLAPFGAMVRVTPIDETHFESGSCTVTHLGSGIAASAAHCVVKGEQTQHHVVFYTKDGKKVFHPIQKFLFVGDEAFDIAIFKVSDEAAATWDSAGARVFPYGALPTDKTIRPDDPVMAWSYTPLENFPNFKEKYPNGVGMVFHPNRCLASQAKPKIEYWKTNPKTHKGKYVGEIRFASGIDPERHVFLDMCNHPILKGNSGSILTRVGNFSLKIGILHCIITEKNQFWKELNDRGLNEKGFEFFYRGVDNRLERVNWTFGAFLVGTGSLFDTLEKLDPRLLPR